MGGEGEPECLRAHALVFVKVPVTDGDAADVGERLRQEWIAAIAAEAAVLQEDWEEMTAQSLVAVSGGEHGEAERELGVAKALTRRSCRDLGIVLSSLSPPSLEHEAEEEEAPGQAAAAARAAPFAPAASLSTASRAASSTRCASRRAGSRPPQRRRSSAAARARATAGSSTR